MIHRHIPTARAAARERRAGSRRTLTRRQRGAKPLSMWRMRGKGGMGRISLAIRSMRTAAQQRRHTRETENSVLLANSPRSHACVAAK